MLSSVPSSPVVLSGARYGSSEWQFQHTINSSSRFFATWPPIRTGRAGQRANRGVFITTSTFTQQAVEFAGSVERIVLIDGSKLADLMIEYEVGAASRAVRIPEIDSDYFEE